MADYRMSDTKRADGCYVTFRRIETFDPHEYLFRAEDQARLDAWKNGDWYFIGVQAQAAVWIVIGGVGTRYTLTSPGLWGIESDSGDDYLSQVFGEECATLRADMAAMGSPLIKEG